MIVVVDASAAAKLVLHEAGSEIARRLWDEPGRWVAPAIILPEVAAAIGAAHRGRRLRGAAARRVRNTWASVSEEIHLREVDTSLAAAAAEFAATRPLRGMDAVYLAIARQLAASGPTALLSFDDRQRDGLLPEDEVHLIPA